MILNKLDPKVKELIQTITELDADKVYLLEISANMTSEQFCTFAEQTKKCFENAGLKCIITQENMIKNVYELERGDDIDPRTSLK